MLHVDRDEVDSRFHHAGHEIDVSGKPIQFHRNQDRFTLFGVSNGFRQSDCGNCPFPKRDKRFGLSVYRQSSRTERLIKRSPLGGVRISSKRETLTMCAGTSRAALLVGDTLVQSRKKCGPEAVRCRRGYSQFFFWNVSWFSVRVRGILKSFFQTFRSPFSTTIDTPHTQQ